MTLSEFLSGRLRRLVLQAVFALASGAFLLATGTEAGIILLLLIIWLLVFLCVQAADFFQCRSRLQELESIMDNLDKKYLFAECVPGSRDIYESRILDLSRRAGRAMIGAVSDAQAAQREYREYVESWVHEIKTPITAAGLICRSAGPEIRTKLSRELSQIEAHVERALFYARAESPEKDFLIRQTPLSSILSHAIDSHRGLLIQNGIRIECIKIEGIETEHIETERIKTERIKTEHVKTEHIETGNLEQTVYTDGKWTAFILGQLLQNAARYRSENPVITLYAKRLGQQVQLTVSDNGIGIPAHELPRVFDRGFTGSNGRTRGGSTGMGLYLCRRLADCLEIDLRIASEMGKGTDVTLTFPARTKLTKM